ncbi:GNAT family N-acetyltransferase [Oceanobacillus salinisoli]|uniref:GNAT family N-acetyltransferase n=1 Tax=Oceanobacillus salinisoli TaxID=2678611 RepID=UPI0012E31E8A|nr:GNAT family N-acetyltransferase [Oceanobacillus salinisoli]
MKNPLLIDFPHEFHTERLFLRAPLPGDGKVIYDAINASLPELTTWMTFTTRNQGIEEAELSVREAHILFLKREDLRFHIFRRDNRTFIGSAGLHQIDWNARKFEVGYWIDTRYSGNGYMTEAVEGLTVFAFYALTANRLEMKIDTENTKSRAIPERLGFTLEGILHKNTVGNLANDLRDTCIYAKVRD